MVVSFFLILRTLLLTSHCVGSFQRPTVPRAGWLLVARRHEDLLRTKNIFLFYMLSAHGSCFSVKQPRSINLHQNPIQRILLFQRNYFFVSLRTLYLGTQQATD